MDVFGIGFGYGPINTSALLRAGRGLGAQRQTSKAWAYLVFRCFSDHSALRTLASSPAQSSGSVGAMAAIVNSCRFAAVLSSRHARRGEISEQVMSSSVEEIKMLILTVRLPCGRSEPRCDQLHHACTVANHDRGKHYELETQGR